MCSALAHILLDMFDEGYVRWLCIHNTQNYDYFIDHWTTTMFTLDNEHMPRKMWNCSGRQYRSDRTSRWNCSGRRYCCSDRTNNISVPKVGWNQRINSSVSQTHPNIWLLVQPSPKTMSPTNTSLTKYPPTLMETREETLLWSWTVEFRDSEKFQIIENWDHR